MAAKQLPTPKVIYSPPASGDEAAIEVIFYQIFDQIIKEKALVQGKRNL